MKTEEWKFNRRMQHENSTREREEMQHGNKATREQSCHHQSGFTPRLSVIYTVGAALESTTVCGARERRGHGPEPGVKSIDSVVHPWLRA